MKLSRSWIHKLTYYGIYKFPTPTIKNIEIPYFMKIIFSYDVWKTEGEV